MGFERTHTVVLTSALVDALLAALSARPAAALLDTPTAHLFVNDIVPGPTTTLGAFTEATFDDYAADALGALLGPVSLGEGRRAVHAEVDFVAGSAIASPGEIAYGVYITDGAGTLLYGAGRFEDPVPFANPGDFLSLDVILPEPAIRDAD